MNIEIRAAKAKDAEAMVPLVYASGPPGFSYVFGAPGSRCDAQKFLLHSLAQEAGEFGCGLHTLASLDGTVVGAGAGYDTAMLSGALWLNVRQIFAMYGPLRGIGVCRRGIAIERLLPPPTNAEWYICHVGVSPELRSRGVGAALMSALIEQGRDRGCATAVLDVSFENPRAQSLYERMGFEVVGEQISTLRSGAIEVPSFRRMGLAL